MRGDAYRKIMPIVERAAFGPTSFGQPPSDKYSGSARKRDSERELRANQRTEILRMVNSGKTSAAEAARLFGLRRSSVSRPMSQARGDGAAIVGQVPEPPRSQQHFNLKNFVFFETGHPNRVA